MTRKEAIKWLEEMHSNTIAPKIYHDENRKKKSEALIVALDALNSKSIDLIPDENGVFHQVYKTLIYHKSKLDRDEFEQWLQGEGGDLFTEYQEKLKRVYPRLCFSCKYFDQGKDQCFDGHLQYADRETCEGFEVVQ